MSGSNRSNKRYSKAVDPYERDMAFLKSRRQRANEAIKTAAARKVEFLSEATSMLRLRMKVAFWSWVFKTARHMAAQDIKTPHEVLISSNPNPYTTGLSEGGSGAAAIAGKVIQLLLLPIQKGIQYWIWKNQPEPVRPARPKTELDKEDHDSRKEWNSYFERLDQWQKDSLAKENLKPRFTRQDAAYLALDITMLALTIATFAVAAPYASAAIAVAAACVSFAVAAYHVGKFLYTSHKLKKDKSAIDRFLEDFDDKTDKQIQAFMRKHGHSQVAGIKPPTRNEAREYLADRSNHISEAIKVDKQNAYTKFRQTFGLGLTMMMVVGAGLMLGGVALGPYGAPLIAAGMALSITAGVIAVGMFIVNAIRNKRAHTKAHTSTRPDDLELEGDSENTLTAKNTNTPPNIVASLTESEKEMDHLQPPEEDNLIEQLDEISNLLHDMNIALASLESKLSKPATQQDTTLSSSKATLHAVKETPNKETETDTPAPIQNKPE